MPSWNIHTAHAERLLEDARIAAVDGLDANAFLFGNYVPDIYVGFMVPDAGMRIDYCLTHMAVPRVIPVPDADLFWDRYVARNAPEDPGVLSLTLGAWSHLVADRFYNGRFRSFAAERGLIRTDELRRDKQADFALFGSNLRVSREVEVTPGLVEAAGSFRPYRVLAADVERAAAVANGIVSSGMAAAQADVNEDGGFRLLDAAWLQSVFDDCNERVATWLAAWRDLAAQDAPFRAADIRHACGLAPATVLEDDE